MLNTGAIISKSLTERLSFVRDALISMDYETRPSRGCFWVEIIAMSILIKRLEIKLPKHSRKCEINIPATVTSKRVEKLKKYIIQIYS